MQDYFIIGDIHGKYGMLKALLDKWDGKAQLVFLGDLIDRGEDSRSVLELVQSLIREKGAWVICGNHEYMFKAWLKDPENRYDHYRRNGGDTTINSLLARPLDHPVDGIRDAQAVKDKCTDLVEMIENLPYFYEIEDAIFVHAGVDLSLDDWKATSDYDKVWIRQPFHEAANHTGKLIFFGHTPTYSLFTEKPGFNKIWQKDQKIGLDGGAVYGGFLYGLTFSQGKIEKVDAIAHDGLALALDD